MIHVIFRASFWNKGTFIFRNYNFFVYINQNAKIGNRKQPHVISLKIGDCAIEIMNIPGAKGLVVVVWISVYSYVPRYLHTYLSLMEVCTTLPEILQFRYLLTKPVQKQWHLQDPRQWMDSMSMSRKLFRTSMSI